MFASFILWLCMWWSNKYKSV